MEGGSRSLVGSRPPSRAALQVTTKVQARFQNLLHARSNTKKKNRAKAVLGDVIQINASVGYFSLRRIY